MSSFSGARILIVEDEPILSLTLQDMLVDLGCVIAGTAARLDAALELVESCAFDVAILDVNLNGKRVDAVAEAVNARGTPIIFVTGYGPTGVPDMSGQVMGKPYDAARLEEALTQALGASQR